MKTMERWWLVPLLGILLASTGAVAQTKDTIPLSLDAVIAQALERSEEVRLAESRVAQADAQVVSVRAGALPQLNANLGYSRTFASAFSGGGGFQIAASLRFQPNPDATLAERVAYLERTVPFAALGGLGQAFGNLPFGQANAYNVGITGSQLLYSGGRIGAALAVARD
jgi:outer membrane protein TolC